MNDSKNEGIGCQSYGIFWDIENCPIPNTERAANVVQTIKQFIITKFEAKVGHQSEPCVFCCSCDTKNLDQRHVEGLNRCGVDILHVNTIRIPFKVDADSKLMECTQKFVEHHSPRSLIFIITGDIDFAPSIRSAKRKGFEVILLFGNNTSQDLRNCATESHAFYSICNRDEPNTSLIHNNPMATSSHTSSTSNATHSTHDLINFEREPTHTTATIGHSSTRVPTIGPNPNQSNQTDAQNRASNPNDAEYDANKLKTIQEITGVERHIALRVLQICNGNVELAVNAIFSD